MPSMACQLLWDRHCFSWAVICLRCMIGGGCFIVVPLGLLATLGNLKYVKDDGKQVGSNLII